MSQNFLSVYAKSFNWAGFFLPKKTYKQCSDLYDFCRTLDDIADQDLDLEMCDSLLKGVLKNWEKLNNSSIAALRETFLIREGILTPNELDYNLDIIKETFDMLLETIPWNISIIQTTFMENRINVDWK